MYSPFVLLFLLSALFSFCSATKKVEKITKIECECDPESTLDVSTLPPFIHPYDHYGNIDKRKIGQLCTMYKKAGVSGLYLLTTMSGARFLSNAQKMEVVDTVCANKKATGFPKTLLCEADGSNYNETLKLARYFKKSCCDAIVTTAPVAYPLMDMYKIAHYAEGVADACYPKPMLYAETYLTNLYKLNPAKLNRELKKIKNFKGMKTTLARSLIVKSVNDVSKQYLISDSSEDTVGPRLFCINGTTTLIATVYPEIIVQIEKACTRGDYKRAVEIQENVYSTYSKAIGLSTKPEKYDQTALIYILNVVFELIKVTKGIDLGKNPYSEQLSEEDKERISQLCEREGLTYNPNDDEEDYAKNYFNESEEDSNKKYPYENNEEHTAENRNSHKGNKNKKPSYPSGKKNKKHSS